MTKNNDPTSLRSQRRKNRNFTGSRPERRALRRLDSALAGYDGSDPSYTKPGKLKHW